ncbi:nucleotide-binding domain-containing protein [Lindgomyces ingoldianus]|uniref:Nucleotide-binding domain-containing protein n=1 Tax=Lindgomyces ingoldianus TaxID=673940 RepID=A0ACB6QWV8_9PLEO|nr:nucleotide-binding domain-containing protein [Lindgomyces ingoldianus]KAF2470995.1 nucleotide-binding domain-containing protein [Lindgomyces ingoldianus]
MTQNPNLLVFGAGVIGLTTALVLRQTYPTSKITIVAKHFPGDRSIQYTSPWAGANWASMAHDNGPLEKYDEVTFHKFSQIAEQHPEAGVGRMGMWGVFDALIEDTGILTPETGKVWYEELVGLRALEENELPSGAKFGLEFASTFRINTQVYLGWLQDQVLVNKITLVRRTYSSLSSLLSDFPTTTILINATGLGSLALTDVKDTNLYPTRGQTVLVAEPKTPINRMYFRSPKRIDPLTTYVFPRPLGGGVILGGSRQDGNWSEEVDMELAKEIMDRCCKICPELGRVEDLQVISHNVGLRPSRKGGPRIELEKGGNGIPVVHNYGHSGAGYQSSWGTAERAVELVKKALGTNAKL